MAKVLEKPELLAPAGDEESLRAAVAAGADAVYFGLRGGFNARARADNFLVSELTRVFDFLHSKNVQGFVTFNTLVFDKELGVAEEALAEIARAGADAIIVQDLGVARLARAVCPELALHASTQMTISSAEAAAVAASLGVTRVVLPRELSIEEIARMAAQTDLELECFVHGALCVSWSGQCLTSEALQARSANRGQCAQSCRLPYDLYVDGAFKDTDQVKYLLSPRDLAAYDLLPELLRAGVSCFKIEGRMKGPEYVANVVDKYRRALDAARSLQPYPLNKRDEEELRYSFSRSFSHGFLKGSDHQQLVHGLYPGHRGVLVGRVEEVQARNRHVLVRAEPDAPQLFAGDRILFDQGKPEDDEPRGGLHACDVLEPGLLKLVFGGPGETTLDLRLVKAGDVVWKAKDAQVTREMKRIAAQERKLAVDLTVTGAVGVPLVAMARDELGREARVESAMPLVASASGNPLPVRVKLGSFGESGFTLRRFVLELEGALALPPSELKRMRRALVEQLEAPRAAPERHVSTQIPLDIIASPVLPALSSASLPPLSSPLAGTPPRLDVAPREPQLIPLLRTLEQVETALRLGFKEVQLDFMELVGLGVACEKVRAAGARLVVATPRVQKPGEEGYDKRFERLRPDGILARHLGAVEHFRRRAHSETVHGDFSLNATNALTARTLLSLGLSTLTPAYDLDLAQLLDLCAGVPAGMLEVTLHQHLPLFHNEHCVYSHLLSNGHDYRDCGRPCETHLIELRDGAGLQHPVIVDVGCRNTVFNAKAQSAATCLPKLLAAGVRRFRVELVRESAGETEKVLTSYRALLKGQRTAREVIREVGALEKYGVSAGTLVVVTQPHA